MEDGDLREPVRDDVTEPTDKLTTKVERRNPLLSLVPGIPRRDQENTTWEEDTFECAKGYSEDSKCPPIRNESESDHHGSESQCCGR